jgi:hypothetical protein
MYPSGSPDTLVEYPILMGLSVINVNDADGYSVHVVLELPQSNVDVDDDSSGTKLVPAVCDTPSTMV